MALLLVIQVVPVAIIS